METQNQPKKHAGELQETTKDFTAIPITKNAIEKIRAYATAAGRIELYGFLVSPIECNDGIVYGAMLAQDQEVSGSSGHIDGVAAVEAKAEIENIGCKALGFWHSHGPHGVFHSGTDNQNMAVRLMSFVGNSEEKEYSIQKDGVSRDDDAQQLIYRYNGLEFRFGIEEGWSEGTNWRPVKSNYFNLAGEPGMQPLIIIAKDQDNKLRLILKDGDGRVIAREPRTLATSAAKGNNVKTQGIAYSIVTNAAGDVYGLLATNKWCSSCERDETKILENVPFNLIETEIEFSKEQLIKDLEERVKGFKSKPESGRSKWFF